MIYTLLLLTCSVIILVLPIDSEVEWVLKKRVPYFFKSYDIPTSLSYHISLALTHAVILQCLSCRATTYSRAAYSASIQLLVTRASFIELLLNIAAWLYCSTNRGVCFQKEQSTSHPQSKGGGHICEGGSIFS